MELRNEVEALDIGLLMGTFPQRLSTIWLIEIVKELFPQKISL
jgi:hypothetical protein